MPTAWPAKTVRKLIFLFPKQILSATFFYKRATKRNVERRANRECCSKTSKRDERPSIEILALKKAKSYIYGSIDRGRIRSRENSTAGEMRLMATSKKKIVTGRSAKKKPTKKAKKSLAPKPTRNDGPPWIQDLKKEPPLSGCFPNGTLLTDQAYHIALDENRRWIIRVLCSRPIGNQNELAVRMAKPRSNPFGGNGEEFFNFNDKSGTVATPANWQLYKFDNEDIWVWVEYKFKADGNLAWSICNAISAQIQSNSPGQNNNCIMEFHSNYPADNVAKIFVSIEFQK
jgi:hypothetical protein